jgi:hypothetical protein
VSDETKPPERTVCYTASNTYFLVGLKIYDPAYTLDSIVEGLNAGLLRLENATAGDARVLVRDPAHSDGRAVAGGLVDTDHQDVECWDFRAEEFLTFGPSNDADARH